MASEVDQNVAVAGPVSQEERSFLAILGHLDRDRFCNICRSSSTPGSSLAVPQRFLGALFAPWPSQFFGWRTPDLVCVPPGCPLAVFAVPGSPPYQSDTISPLATARESPGECQGTAKGPHEDDEGTVRGPPWDFKDIAGGPRRSSGGPQRSPGGPLAVPWQSPGSSLAVHWRLPGGRLAVPWRSPGGCLAVAGRLPGGCLAVPFWWFQGRFSRPFLQFCTKTVPWRSPGGPLAVPWRSPGGRLAVP